MSPLVAVMPAQPVKICINADVTNEALNALFAASWPNYHPKDFRPVLAHSLVYVCAYQEQQLIGFVNVAWDGGVHAFILDTTVHPLAQRRGVGQQLVQSAAIAAREKGCHWLHVDYEPHLEAFYQQCGFAPTCAGVLQL